MIMANLKPVSGPRCVAAVEKAHQSLTWMITPYRSAYVSHRSNGFRQIEGVPGFSRVRKAMSRSGGVKMHDFAMLSGDEVVMMKEE